MSIDQKPAWFEYRSNPQEPDDHQLWISNVAQGPPKPERMVRSWEEQINSIAGLSMPVPMGLKEIKQAIELHEKKLRLIIVRRFVEQVNELAQEKMTATGKLEGAHYAAMMQLLQEMEAEVNGDQGTDNPGA